MSAVLPRRVHIQEVSPRDGLQIEPRFLPTAKKVELVNRLGATGVSKIEVTSFVSPSAIPNLRDAAAVMAGIRKNPAVSYVALVPNLRGAEAAVVAGVDEINLVMSASETHNLANMRMTCRQSLDGFAVVATSLSDAAVSINGTVATAFGCPFEGPVALNNVHALVDRYLSLGFDSITLADTTGMANPRQVTEVVGSFRERFPSIQLTLHFHNTRGLGLANVQAALQAGADRFDSSLGGIGGCPYAPGASGNVCTEDLAHMVETMGIASGVDLAMLIDLSRHLPGLLGHDVPGQVAKAGRAVDLHPVPLQVRSLQAKHVAPGGAQEWPSC